jgi:hypothetical protein
MFMENVMRTRLDNFLIQEQIRIPKDAPNQLFCFSGSKECLIPLEAFGVLL